jgi:hypothetical protein
LCGNFNRDSMHGTHGSHATEDASDILPTPVYFTSLSPSLLDGIGCFSVSWARTYGYNTCTSKHH